MFILSFETNSNFTEEINAISPYSLSDVMKYLFLYRINMLAEESNIIALGFYSILNYYLINISVNYDT